MNDALAFVCLVVLFVAFAVLIAVVVLRFTTVITQLKRTDSFERSEMMRELDQSHVVAFSNAMAAMERVSERIAANQTGMFERTMDMVHGPQRQPEPGQEYSVDDPRLDARPAWMPNDDQDTSYLYADPTDDLEPDPPSFGTNDPGPEGESRPDDSNGYAVNVRPGEGLIPH